MILFLLRLRIGVLGSGNRFTWEHREAVSYLTYLGLGFLIWKVREVGTRLATLRSLWSLQVRRFSGGFQSYVLFGGFCCCLFCFKRRKNCFSSRCDWELLGVPPVQGPVARGGHTEMRMTILVGEDAFTGAYNAE